MRNYFYSGFESRVAQWEKKQKEKNSKEITKSQILYVNDWRKKVVIKCHKHRE